MTPSVAEQRPLNRELQAAKVADCAELALDQMQLDVTFQVPNCWIRIQGPNSLGGVVTSYSLVLQFFQPLSMSWSLLLLPRPTPPKQHFLWIWVITIESFCLKRCHPAEVSAGKWTAKLEKTLVRIVICVGRQHFKQHTGS